MDWARRRHWTVLAILIAVVITVLLILGFAIFYKTPTCFDTKQNGSETGIDCGGSCLTVCSAAANPATVRFARALPQSGRTDLIAYIDNPNRTAYAKDAHITVEAYAEDGSRFTRHLSMTLLPAAATPIFVPGIAEGTAPIRQAFARFDTGYPIWTKQGSDIILPTVGASTIETPYGRPRVTATLANPTAYPMRNIPLIATVFTDDGSAIAASQTVIPLLPAQGTAPVTFTWNEPFSANAARVEIVPVATLPQPLP